MSCRLVLLSSELEARIRGFTLHESQMNFVFTPRKALDFFRNQDCIPVVILLDEEPVGFFVLHNSDEVRMFTDNDKAIFLRAFSIDKMSQGKGYAKLAISCLPSFVLDHFPQVDEIILSVNENNFPAKGLYENSGFKYKGMTNRGRSGVENIMHYSFNHS